MQKLVDGIHRFQNYVFGSKRELFASLAYQQKPHCMFITCSDSRICPNLITQSDPGDMFVLRNAGNLIPEAGTIATSEAATIEFAVAVLKVQDIVICGHTDCGAMKALIEPAAASKLRYMSDWLKNASRASEIIRERYRHLSGRDLLTAAIQENVMVQTENLLTHPAVKAALQQKRLRLHAWVYKVQTGQIFGYDPTVGQFAELNAKKAIPYLFEDGDLDAMRDRVSGGTLDA